MEDYYILDLEHYKVLPERLHQLHTAQDLTIAFAQGGRRTFLLVRVVGEARPKPQEVNWIGAKEGSNGTPTKNS